MYNYHKMIRLLNPLVVLIIIIITNTNKIYCLDVCDTSLCDCHLNIADCKSRNILDVDDMLTFPDYITNIDLSSNNISTLENIDIDIKSDVLECFDISSNILQIIDFSTFENINSSLLALNLKNNLIKQIDEDAFLSTPYLVRLDLSYNQIEDLPEAVFEDLTELEHLDLSFNSMKQLKETIFMRLQKLKFLNLSFLKLSQIAPEIFDWNLTITTLDMSNNYFTSVPSDALWYLRKTLDKFTFSGNLLREIPTGAFVGLSHLKVLILEQQLYLRRIDKYAFGHLTSLETFVLRYVPQIRSIHPKAFHINSENQTEDLRCPVRDLTIEFTTLTTLHEELLNWDKMRYVNLMNDRWMCDCHLKWIKNSNLEEITNYSIYCYGPLKNRGKNTKTIPEKQFTCEILIISTRSGAMVLLGIIVIALLISFTTVIVLVYRRNGWLWNPPRVSYDKIDSPLNTITIFDRSVESLTELDGKQRNTVYIHDV